MSVTAETALARALAAAAPLAELFAAAGQQLFLVGGVVRDALQGRFVDSVDIDCTTPARPETTRSIVSPAASALWSQGERFGTIGCLLGGQPFEITTHRAERYDPDSRKPTVAFGDDLHEDLERRDFTVNAMAVDASSGKLIDPHGGSDDLKAQILRTPLTPEVSFEDDPLRMLRAARFAASHGLKPSDDLLDAVTAMGQRMSIVAKERVRAEFERLLLLPDPTPGIRFLFETALVNHTTPFLSACEAETLSRVVAATSATTTARWAALFVGCRPGGASRLGEASQPVGAGQPVAAGRLGGANQVVTADQLGGASQHMRAMRCSNDLIESVAGLLSACHLLAPPPQNLPSIRRLVHACAGVRACTETHACATGVDFVLDFAVRVVTAKGDSTASLERCRAALTELRRHEDVDSLVVPLRGEDVMEVLGLEPGPAVGKALAYLRELMFEQGALTRPEAVAALRARGSLLACQRDGVVSQAR